MMRFALAALAVMALALTGCGGSGPHKVSRKAAEEDAAKARYAVEHLEPVEKRCPNGQMDVEVTRPGEGSQSCVARRNVSVEIKRLTELMKRRCPQGGGVVKNLSAESSRV
jgi:hypothetical protein